MKKNILLYLLMFPINILFAQETQTAHEKDINFIVFSPDNKLVITGADDKTVKVWDAGTGSMKKSFKHSYHTNKIFVSPDGLYLITGNGNFYHCLWDLREGKAVRCFLDQQIEGFTPDGKSIIAIGYGNDGHKFANFCLIDIETFERTEFPHKIYMDSLVHGLAMTSKGKNFLIATGNKTVYVIDKNDPGKMVKQKLKNETSIIALSPDDKYFVTEGSKNIYEVKNFKQALELEEPTKPSGLSSIRYTNDGRFLLSVYHNNLDIIGVDSGKILKRYTFNKVKKFGVSNNGKFVSYTNDGKTLNIRQVESGEAGILMWDKELAERNAFSNYMTGIYYLNAKQYSQAVDYFTAAMKIFNTGDLYFFRGRAFLNSGKITEAIEDFQKDYKINPGRATINLAKAYTAKADFTPAANYLKEYMNTKSMTTLNELEHDRELEKLRKSKIWSDLVRQYNKSESEKLADISLEKINKKDLMGAMEFINKAVKKDPKSAKWVLMRAELNMKLKQYDKAITDYKTSADLDSSKEAEAYINIAKAMSRKGELNQAAFMLNKLIERDSSQFSYLLDIASLRYTTFQKTYAMDAVNRYIKIIPNDPYGFYTRARICDDNEKSKNDIEHAITLMKKMGAPVPAEFMDFKKSLD